LQMPDAAIGPPNPDDTELDVPEECVQFLSADLIPNPKGYPFLSRKGYKHYKIYLKQEFSTKRGATWADFEKHAREHFKAVDKKIEKEIAKAEKRLAYLKAL
jgi:hypothetical protein